MQAAALLAPLMAALTPAFSASADPALAPVTERPTRA